MTENTLPNPVMYPLADNPNWTYKFDTVDALQAQLETQDESLNMVVSWFVHDALSDDYAQGEAFTFAVLLFMPRKSKTTEFRFTGPFDAHKVRSWVEAYLRPRVMRWYGFQEKS